MLMCFLLAHACPAPLLFSFSAYVRLNFFSSFPVKIEMMFYNAHIFGSQRIAPNLTYVMLIYAIQQWDTHHVFEIRKTCSEGRYDMSSGR